MKNIIILLVALCFQLSFSQAQEAVPSMLISAGGTEYDEGSCIAYDAAGNMYVCGRFSGTALFGNTTIVSAGAQDIFLAKYNSNGNFQWAKRAGGTIYDEIRGIAVNGTEVYITGRFEGTANFNTPSASGSNEISSAGGADIFLAKYNSSGDFQWAKRAGGTGSDCAYGIALNGTEVYITGSFLYTANFNTPIASGSNEISSAGGADIFLAKYNSSGDFQWAKRAGGTGNDYAYGIELNNNELYITGQFCNTANFNTPSASGSNEITSAGGYDIFLAKYNSSGDFQWAKRAGGTNNEMPNDIVLNSTEVYIMGYFYYTANFNTPYVAGSNEISSAGGADIFLAKYNTSGDFQWAKRAGGPGFDSAQDIAVNGTGVYITGAFENTPNFNTPSVSGSNEITSAGGNDIFLAKYNSSGAFQWAKRAGGMGIDVAHDIALKDKEVCITGRFQSTANFNTPSAGGSNEITSVGSGDIFIAKYVQPTVYGYIYNDINQNCTRENEVGIIRHKVLINPGNRIVETNINGLWYIDSLPAGNYTIAADTSGNWRRTCPLVQNFTIANSDSFYIAPSFGFVSTQPCAEPEISVNMPRMRRGFSNQAIYLQACNEYKATGALVNAYVTLELDPLIIPQSASTSYTSLGGNKYKFVLANDTLNPGQCETITMNCSLSTGAVLNSTLCIKANLYPADSCVFDTIPNTVTGVTPCTLPWDKSSLKVTGKCTGDSVRFVVYNHGSGDMDCYAPVRIYIDGLLAITDSIKLVSGDSTVYTFLGNGRAWRLEADQHPLHPGNSHPNATIENCGTGTWTPNLVNVLPPDDADPVVDIYCGVVTGSYDPNDKRGYPLGVDTAHNILPNQQMEYVIRFQNTGTDTAFTVVIRDTLDMDLDIFSVVSGVSLHKYKFKMYGPRILEWTFNNILLPDSNVNEAKSHGFVTFTVNQNRNLTNGTLLENTAGIYFDYNAPVITNTTVHTVNDQIITKQWTHQQTLTLADCESVSVNGYTYTQTGSYYQVHEDTLITVNATINNKKRVQNITVCAGESITVGTNTYTSAGTYTDVLTSSLGCDSTVTTNLTINSVDTSVVQNTITLTAQATAATYQWLDCTAGYTPISGQTGKVFTATTNGVYAVIVTKNGCSDTSACYAVTQVGLRQAQPDMAQHDRLVVYPNPATDELVVVRSSSFVDSNANIEIYNVIGIKMLEVRAKKLDDEIIIDISDLPKGMYVVKSGAEAVKLVVE